MPPTRVLCCGAGDVDPGEVAACVNCGKPKDGHWQAGEHTPVYCLRGHKHDTASYGTWVPTPRGCTDEAGSCDRCGNDHVVLSDARDPHDPSLRFCVACSL